MADRDSSPPLTARLLSGVAAVDAAQWNALAGPDDPFLSHAFLALLEDSGSVGPGTGWTPATLLVDAPNGDAAPNAAPLAALPAYLKTHSQGEYVFDHGWAEAWEHAGGHYYPKLQIAVPFTPVPGRRLLAANDAGARAAIAAAEALVTQNDLSSAHATFVAADQLPLFASADWLIRTGSQFHWANRDYRSFDDFLAQLSSRKRKTIRHERAVANAAVSIAALTGDAIQPHHWDAMWTFYQDTGARKWGQPYLTRAAFTLLGERMADTLLLIIASIDGMPVAGALNVIGADALYGRYWGCTQTIPCLHFELCYYQAIDFAIAHGLSRVEAGAQGEHKLARGYLPVPTYSAHYLPDPGFRRAVADYLVRETRGVEQERGWLGQLSPFKEGY
jgi:uncharacterized protein